MPGTAAYRIADFCAARYIFQHIAVKLNVGKFRKIGFRFVFVISNPSDLASAISSSAVLHFIAFSIIS
jgi:hypothetical protein